MSDRIFKIVVELEGRAGFCIYDLDAEEADEISQIYRSKPGVVQTAIKMNERGSRI